MLKRLLLVALATSACEQTSSGTPPPDAGALDAAGGAGGVGGVGGGAGGAAGGAGGAGGGVADATPADGAVDDAGVAADAAVFDAALPDAALPLPAAEPMPLRRLSRVELANTLRDLLGDDGGAVELLPPDVESLGFDNQATSQAVPDLLAERYLTLAETVTERIDLAALAPCAEGSEGAACAREFFNGFVPLAFRRPAEPEEIDRFVESYTLGAAEGGAGGGHTAGLAFALQHLLNSPHFLYRVETTGEPVTRPDGVVVTPLDGHALAVRLSYFLWRTMPDAELMRAAAAGELATAEGVRAQAQRMLDDPRAAAMIADFHGQWLGVDHLPVIEKDAAFFPGFDAARAALQAEAQAFAVDVFLSENGTLTDLLTASHAFVSPETAAIYGVDAPAAPLTRVELDPTLRAGLLTLPGVLAVHAQSTRTSPVLRGYFVREQLFCGGVPPPPPGTDTSVPFLDPANPDFENDPFAETMANPECVGCHRLMNPIGQAFERFDASGRYAPDRTGREIPVAGELFRSDVDGLFEGPVELARRLAASDQVADCVTTHWWRFAHGHKEREPDAAQLADVRARFRNHGGHLETLLIELVTADQFRHR